jgi:hypothetical protein
MVMNFGTGLSRDAPLTDHKRDGWRPYGARARQQPAAVAESEFARDQSGDSDMAVLLCIGVSRNEAGDPERTSGDTI